MIYFVRDNRHCYTDRSYLAQWFADDILMITDEDVNHVPDLESLVRNHACPRWLVDFSHNQMSLRERPAWLDTTPALSCEWLDWYQPRSPQTHYFPLWMWMFSLRTNQWYPPMTFDAMGHKTRPMMCLNRNPHPHRLQFARLIAPIRSRMVFTLGADTLPGESLEPHSGLAPIDVSVGSRVYSECAVNIVTESVIDRSALSEKSCKPFVARQIPVIVGATGLNQFLSDCGLDMFADLVPWHTWDQEPDHHARMSRIAAFVIGWLESGTVLEDYRACQQRVERNKQYFHSDRFRDLILRRMPVLDPYWR